MKLTADGADRELKARADAEEAVRARKAAENFMISQGRNEGRCARLNWLQIMRRFANAEMRVESTQRIFLEVGVCIFTTSHARSHTHTYISHRLNHSQTLACRAKMRSIGVVNLTGAHFFS